jgi:hypothetical protein
MRHTPGSARPLFNLVLRLGYSLVAALLAWPICSRQTRLLVRASTTRSSVKNALAALFAGVVYPLHPLAGIDSARLLLFSGDAISYYEQLSHAVHSGPSQLFGDVSLLNGELALPIPGWPASAA